MQGICWTHTLLLSTSKIHLSSKIRRIPRIVLHKLWPHISILSMSLAVGSKCNIISLENLHNHNLHFVRSKEAARARMQANAKCDIVVISRDNLMFVLLAWDLT